MNVALWAEIRRLSEIEKLSHRTISPGAVSIDGNSQQVMEQEISYAASAGLNYWAFVDCWDQGNLGIEARRPLNTAPRVDGSAAAAILAPSNTK